jgi:NAD(P)-dependent dehydrogenase (short-subunit alcohol dehydrogenase family)
MSFLAKVSLVVLHVTSQGSGKLEVVEVNMNSFDSVKKAARVFLAKSSKLNILVNNAGVHETHDGDFAGPRSDMFLEKEA